MVLTMCVASLTTEEASFSIGNSLLVTLYFDSLNRIWMYFLINHVGNAKRQFLTDADSFASSLFRTAKGKTFELAIPYPPKLRGFDGNFLK